MCEQHTTTDAESAKVQTHSAKTSRFWSLFTQWVCSLATTPPQTASSSPPNGGNCIIRAATRRRYPASQLLMLQNPHRRRCGGAEAPQSMAAGTGPVAEPGPVAVAGRQARHNSPSTPSPPLNPRQNSPSAAAPPVFSRQNSPSNLKNVKFGVFRARRANFFTLTPTIRPCWANYFTHRTRRRATLKPTTPLLRNNAPKTLVSSPQRRWQFQLAHLIGEQRRRRFHAKDLRHQQVPICRFLRRIARNSIGPTPQQNAETLKYQRIQFKS